MTEVASISDDIIVQGRDMADHDQKLTTVLEYLRERAYFEQGEMLIQDAADDVYGQGAIYARNWVNQNQGRSCTAG